MRVQAMECRRLSWECSVWSVKCEVWCVKSGVKSLVSVKCGV